MVQIFAKKQHEMALELNSGVFSSHARTHTHIATPLNLGHVYLRTYVSTHSHKFCIFYFRIQKLSCEICENLHHVKISRYTVLAPNVPPFTASPGVLVPISNDVNPLHYFQLFLSTRLITYIVECTNVYATVRLGRMPPSRRSLFRSWKPATVAEIKAFVGVMLNMGLVQLSQLKDYWLTHKH